MKIATWNVNSLKARLPRVEAWIGEHQPDVLVMQETKCADAAFPTAAFDDLGYASTHHGNGRWNGVAILSRVGTRRRPGGIHRGGRGLARGVPDRAGDCAGVKVMSVYVPNGRSVDSEFFEQKLAWLGQLRRELDLTCQPDDAVAILGDFNIAPEDRDVWDITQFDGMTHVTPAERGSPREGRGLGTQRRDARHVSGGDRALHVVGLPRRRLPQGLGDAHRSGACERTGPFPAECRIPRSRRPEGPTAVRPRSGRHRAH